MKIDDFSKIYVDDREDLSFYLPIKEKYGIPIEVVHLPVADAVVNGIGIERKTLPGYIQDILSRRLFEQAFLMKQNFEKSCIVIVGGFYVMPEHVNAVYGAYVSLWMLGIPTFVIHDREAYAKFLAFLFLQNKKRKKPLVIKRKPKEIPEIQKAMLMMLPGIGERKAVALLAKFGTLRNLASADIPEIASIKGITAEKAKKIKDVFQKPFQEKT